MNDHSSDSLDFLGELPQLGREDILEFRCGPDVPCFNECCGDLDLSLSPYDVIRLRHALGMSSKAFLSEYTQVGRMSGNGFPVVMLDMRGDERRSCPFVQADGCSVYGDRPGACRVYPLGRGASIGEDGTVVEQFILIREKHCAGLGRSRRWTVVEYLENQGMGAYIDNDDRYMRLLHRVNRTGRDLREDQFVSAFMATYRPDELERFSKMLHPSIPLTVSVPKDDSPAYETEVFRGGLRWLEEILGL